MPLWRDIVKAISSGGVGGGRVPGGPQGQARARLPRDPELPEGGSYGQPANLDEPGADSPTTGVVAFGKGDTAQVFTDAPYAIVVTLGDRRPLPQDPADPQAVKIPFGTTGTVRAAGPDFVWLDLSRSHPDTPLVKLHRRDVRNTTPVTQRRRWAHLVRTAAEPMTDEPTYRVKVNHEAIVVGGEVDGSEGNGGLPVKTQEDFDRAVDASGVQVTTVVDGEMTEAAAVDVLRELALLDVVGSGGDDKLDADADANAPMVRMVPRGGEPFETKGLHYRYVCWLFDPRSDEPIAPETLRGLLDAPQKPPQPRREKHAQTTRVAMPMPTGLPEGWRVTWDEDADIGSIELKLLDATRKVEATLTLERVEAGRGRARTGDVWQVSEVRAKNRGSGWGAFLRMYALRKLSSRGAYVQSDSSVSESGQRFWRKLYETAQNPTSGVERVPVDRRVMRNMNDRDQATREQFFQRLTLGPDGKVTNMPLVETPDVQARYRFKGAGLGLGLPALVTALGLMGAPGDGDVSRSSGGSAVGESTEAQRKQTYAALVDQVARAEGVDPEVIHAMIRAESRYQHGASSDKGAVGLMQTTPITAKQMGVPPPTTPEESVQLGVRYMRYLLRMFRGDLELALAAYNRGPTAVKESLAARGRPPHTPETVNYVRRVLRALGQLPRHYTDAEIERHRPL